MRFVLFALVLPAFAAQGEDAEKLFRAMEKKIDSAKTLRVACDMDTKTDKTASTIKATLALAPGNKARINMKIKSGGKDVEMEIVSDGNKIHMSMTPPGNSKQAATPKNLSPLLGKTVSRIGPVGVIFLVRRLDAGKEGPGPSDIFKIKDFKMGEPAKVQGRAAKVLHYRLEIRAVGKGDETARATLWLDAKTLLPLKQVIVPEGKDGDDTLTETYTEFQLDPKLDAKTFELPK